MKIGCHLSIAKGYLHIGKEAHAIGANTFQFFSRNPRGGSARALNTEDIAALREFMAEHGFAPILAHALSLIHISLAHLKSEIQFP